MRKLWGITLAIVVFSFAILGWIGSRIYQQKPPIPERVVTSDGQLVIEPGQILRGQHVWQALGGMEVGSVWGHGSYVAPDWTADWLHRELIFVLNEWAQAEFGRPWSQLDAEAQARLQGRLQAMYRQNRYDPATGTLTIEPVRARAFKHCLEHYSEVFLHGSTAYAMPPRTVANEQDARDLAAFFFWTAWAAATNRPGDDISYTHNWPHEPLVGNRPTGESVMWTGVSIIMLLAGICAMVWWYAAQKKREEHLAVPSQDPLESWQPSASQKAVLKYFWVVAGLMMAQILAGVITAHYGVEGGGFYGIPLARWLPYSVTRTWHIQLGLFWIATAWLASGLFIGPLASGVEPRGQRTAVNLLFVALVAVVVGSLAGQWLSIHHKLSGRAAFYWGHQGYEYLDLGRIWQVLVFIALLAWFALMLRTLRPALARSGDERQLLWLFILSSGAIGLFYGAGLMWGRNSHLSIAEYWRWWVVHLWVEGFFELFATVVIAFFFTRLKLIRPSLAAQASLMATAIYLAGGIIGTCHHLYFSGTPTVALAFGAVFSALEVIPLTFIAYSAMEDYRRLELAPWVQRYKWPVYFFLAVAFWNMVGAGLFGFLINPPIALYFMQGLNTTPVHGHAALFGVYGMLSLALILTCLRALAPQRPWSDRWLKFSFWALNVGLLLMCVGSLLPVGLLQTWASVDQGYWYARSSEFLGSSLMQTLRWMRVPGDTIFAAGALAVSAFILRNGRVSRA